MINIVEIKAKSSNHGFVRDVLISNHAIFKGKDHQIDTYLKVNHGRLKLREGNIENNLIHYHRSNQKDPKLSQVTLYKSDPDTSLKKILTDANGILVVVDKIREIYFIDNVKFHIDTVQDLGTFIEIEAIDEEEIMTKQELHDQCTKYMAMLQINDADLTSVSYSDLMLEI